MNANNGERQTWVCVTGASGFIGRHLCHFLRQKGYWVRGVDWQPPRFGPVDCDEHDWDCDLRKYLNAEWAVDSIDHVYALAADMGGALWVFSGDNDLDIMRNNILININTLEAARLSDVKRYFFSSSACTYPEYRQEVPDAVPLAEEDAYPAEPDSEYGWEKLFTERLCGVYAAHSPMRVRIARFHNMFGPEGAWNDGREKLPAAACRKIAMAASTGRPVIVVWGDGEQTRSFCYIDDCLEMIYRLMHSDHEGAMNIGTDRLVSVDEVYDIVAGITGVQIEKVHDLSKPQGVRGRNADLTLMRQVLGYEPQVSLEEGLARTYAWVSQEIEKNPG